MRFHQHDIDAVLDVVERGPLIAGELRILLALLDGERAISELARTFGHRSADIRRTGARLLGRGLIRWRQTGPGKEAVLGISPAGLAALRPLRADPAAHVQAA